ncbi:MAG: glycoside hydrolase family 3 C-terminal domain-containing protein [Thermoclostridium sp.]|nr:glycoside hydrolase family 3 C-terminal domain-containing protein [Thermoclostridium sp.]
MKYNHDTGAGRNIACDYKNPMLSAEERTRDLLSRMTLEEKVGQLVQIPYSEITREDAVEWVEKRFAGSFLHVLGEDAQKLQERAMKTRLGIPLMFGIDAIHGHSLYNGATIFPTQLGMSCSWNPDLIQQMGRVTGREVAADGLHWTFSPVLCIGRDLRWGRINETFGEDPYLIGELSAAIIKGYQGNALSDDDSILACAKHYLAYGESTGARDAQETPISERKVREIFLPPFKRAVEAGCATFMSAYLAIDGTPVTINRKYLRTILKEELGFDGFVVTDWNNTGTLVDVQYVASEINEAATMAVEAGNDMLMSTLQSYDALLRSVRQGRLDEKIIDEAAGRVLKIKFAMGLFDNPGKTRYEKKADIFACPQHLAVNEQLTQESIVLLENKNNLLPLGGNIREIAVIGPNADDIKAQFGDWTFFTHPHPHPEAVPQIPVYTMLNGIRKESERRGIRVNWHQGCDIMDENDQDIAGAVSAAKTADAIIAVVGDCRDQNGETRDRANLDLSGAQLDLLKALKKTGKPLIIILVNGKPLSVPWVKQNADAVLETFNSGMFGGKATADILFGNTNPSGKLSISFPYHSGQLPVYYNQLPGWHGGKYMDMPAEPLYSFGYGLSYTQWQYSNLRLSSTECGAQGKVDVMIDLTNAGSVDGHEVVQLYVRDDVSSVVTPIKQLKGFQKVFVKAGETMTVTIPLDICALCVIREDGTEAVEPGTFTIMVGPDSRDEVLLKVKLEIKEI